jgi:hypothetical protein
VSDVDDIHGTVVVWLCVLRPERHVVRLEAVAAAAATRLFAEGS